MTFRTVAEFGPSRSEVSTEVHPVESCTRSLLQTPWPLSARCLSPVMRVISCSCQRCSSGPSCYCLAHPPGLERAGHSSSSPHSTGQNTLS